MMLDAVFYLAHAVLELLWWAVLLAVIVQNLIQFGVLDQRNRLVWTMADFLERVTDPVLRPVRRALPNFGPIDISPIIVLLLVTAVDQFLLPATRGYLRAGGLYF